MAPPSQELEPPTIPKRFNLLPYLDFDVALALANARKVNPEIVVFSLSARTGEGMDKWYDWLKREAAAIAGLEKTS